MEDGTRKEGRRKRKRGAASWTVSRCRKCFLVPRRLFVRVFARWLLTLARNRRRYFFPSFLPSLQRPRCKIRRLCLARREVKWKNKFIDSRKRPLCAKKFKGAAPPENRKDTFALSRHGGFPGLNGGFRAGEVLAFVGFNSVVFRWL